MIACLIKSVVFYFLIVTMIMFIKPQCIYSDVQKTKIKPWNLYLHTKNINDLLTLHSIIVFICIISVIITILK